MGEANIGHLAGHKVLPEEAEQVVLNDPVDVGAKTGYAFITAFEPIKRLIQFYFQERGR